MAVFILKFKFAFFFLFFFFFLSHTTKFCFEENNSFAPSITCLLVLLTLFRLLFFCSFIHRNQHRIEVNANYSDRMYRWIVHLHRHRQPAQRTHDEIHKYVHHSLCVSIFCCVNFRNQIKKQFYSFSLPFVLFLFLFVLLLISSRLT